jgi:2-amino-4-hydroxy-6-hydroxymethyldihydropteridine diphosphokinase
MLCILALGTNLGNRLINLKTALENLKEELKVLKTSNIYESVSLLKDEQENYYNMVILVETDYSPEKLLELIKSIEKKMGRIKKQRWKERIIDIDIIDYDNMNYYSKILEIPHPRMHERSFVLYPLSELVDDYVHPKYNKNINEMIESLDDNLNIRILTECNIC